MRVSSNFTMKKLLPFLLLQNLNVQRLNFNLIASNLILQKEETSFIKPIGVEDIDPSLRGIGKPNTAPKGKVKSKFLKKIALGAVDVGTGIGIGIGLSVKAITEDSEKSRDKPKD